MAKREPSINPNQTERHIMYTHEIVRSKQRCFGAAWWPTKDPAVGNREKTHPLMVLESGQITRVRRDNLRRLPIQTGLLPS